MRGQEGRKLHIVKRFVSTLLSCLLTLALAVPSAEPVFATEPWAADLTTTTQTLLVDMMRTNLMRSLNNNPQDSGEEGGSREDKTASITDADIVQTFQDTRLANQEWDTVNLHDVAVKLIERLKANIGEGEVTLDNARIIDYTENTMRLDYNFGQMAVDWAVKNVAYTAAIGEDKARDVFVMCMADAGGNPFISMKAYGDAIKQEAENYASSNNDGSHKDSLLKKYSYPTYQQYIMKGNQIPAGTLFIGTWLVDAQSLNGPIYNKAVRSMAEEDQQIMYYKSELAGGRWRNISSASSLNAILPSGDEVDESELQGYYVSVVVGQDGIPRDTNTGQYVDIFTISNPYDLENLPELRSIKLQLDNGNLKPKSKGGEGPGAYTYDRVWMFFHNVLPYPRNDTTKAVLDWWKDPAVQRQYQAWDYNSDATMKSEGVGWRRSVFGIRWWSDDNDYMIPKNEYSGTWPVIDMLQTEAEYGHEVTYYLYRRTDGFNYWRSKNIFNDYYLWYWPWTRITRYLYPRDWQTGGYIYTGVDAIDLSFWTLGRMENLRDSNRIQLMGRAYAMDVLYDIGGNDASEADFRNKVNIFKQFWLGSSSIQDEETDKYDAQLKALENLYLPLKQAGYEEEADRAMLLQEKIDSARRARAMYNLVLNEEHNYGFGAPLNNLFSQVAYGMSQVGRSYSVMAKDYGDSDGTSFTPDATMINVVGDAVTQATSAFNNYDDTALKNGDTVAQQYEYDTSMWIIDNASQGAEAMRTRLQNLTDLDNILAGTVQHKDREISVLDTLQVAADARITEQSHETANTEYINAKNDPDASQEELRKILQNQKAGLSATIGEGQQFIRGRVIRYDRNAALSYIDQRINWADGLKAGVASDDYGSYEIEAIDAHIEWLMDLKKTVTRGLKEKEEDPSAEKETLNLQRLDLLDDGDLDGVNELDKEISDADDKKDAERNKNLAILEGTGDAASKADAEANLDDIEAAKRDIGKDIIKKIENDDWENIYDPLDAAGDLGLPMDDILNKLKEAGAPAVVYNYADDNAERAKSSPFYDDGRTGDGEPEGGQDGSGNGPYDGDGSGTGGGSGDGAGDGSGNTGGGGTGGAGGPGDTDGGDGSGSGDNGDGTGGGGTDTGGAGGSGTGGTGGGSGLNDGGGNGRSGLNGKDLNGAISDVFGGPFDGLSDYDKASVTAGLSKFAENRDDDEIRKRVKDLLNQLLAEGNGFIYRQYLADPDKKYVSLAAVDKCRPLTKNRCVTIGDKATMSQIAGGSASYVFTIGTTTVEKNNGKNSEMDTPTVQQSDPSIRGSKTAQYPYITEESSSLYLQDTCEYIPDTEWAILIAPSMSKKVIQLLEALDGLADE